MKLVLLSQKGVCMYICNKLNFFFPHPLMRKSETVDFYTMSLNDNYFDIFDITVCPIMW